MRGDGGHDLFAHRTYEADRLGDAGGLRQPLQRVLGNVGDFGPAEEALEEPQARGEIAVAPGGDCDVSGAAVGAVSPRRAAHGAGRQQAGGQVRQS